MRHVERAAGRGDEFSPLDLSGLKSKQKGGEEMLFYFLNIVDIYLNFK